MASLDQCLAVLKARGVDEVRYYLSGGGDLGATELESVIYRDGSAGPLPDVSLAFTDVGGVVALDERLDDVVYEIPDGDWINNEGGHGRITLRPQEADPQERVECDVAYGDDDEERDFDDDDDFESTEFDGAEDESTGGTITIDDASLQTPDQGETP